ncbi:hypothetical protein NPIL_694101, partial [Nephila pilipes]
MTRRYGNKWQPFKGTALVEGDDDPRSLSAFFGALTRDEG